MPESIKIKIDLDTASAELSLEELERRIEKISKSGAELFRNIASRTGGSIPSAKSPQEMAREFARTNFPQVFSSATTLYPEFLLRGAQQAAKRMGELKLPIEHLLAPEKLLTLGARNLLKMGPLGTAGTMMPESFLRQGAMRSMGMGPLFPPPINWRQAAMGGALGAFSPWLGARALNQAFGGRSIFGGLFGGGGGGGGGGGAGRGSGLLGAMFGGGASGFAEWYLLIRTIQLLRVAMRELWQTVQRGSELYRQAARTATSVGKLAQIQAVGAGLGFSPELMNRMIEQGQFGRGGRVVTANEMILRARMGASGMGDVQQIVNMRKELEFLIRQTSFGAKNFADASKAMNRMNMDLAILKNDWQAFWAQLAKTMEPWIRTILILFDGLMKALTFIVAHGRQALLQALVGNVAGLAIEKGLEKAFPSGGPGGTKIGGNAPQRPESGWEKMGLIINGGINGRDYARQTAENTKKIADHVTKLFPVADPTWGAQQPNFNLP
jgi:hypothetical protein